MRYRYLDNFRRGISVFAIFSDGVTVLGTPQCPPPIANQAVISVIKLLRIPYRKKTTVNFLEGNEFKVILPDLKKV